MITGEEKRIIQYVKSGYKNDTRKWYQKLINKFFKDVQWY